MITTTKQPLLIWTMVWLSQLKWYSSFFLYYINALNRKDSLIKLKISAKNVFNEVWLCEIIMLWIKIAVLLSWHLPRLPPWLTRLQMLKGCWALLTWRWTISFMKYNDGIDRCYCCLCSPFQELLTVALLVGLDQLISCLTFDRFEPVGNATWEMSYRLESSYISFSALLA